MDETIKNGEPRKKLVYAGQMHFFHWLIIFFSIILTLSAWYYSKSQFNQKLESKFQRNAEQVVDLVKERMGLYENALWSGVAHIDSVSENISYTDWLAYANSLKLGITYPGINGIGIIYNIQPEQLNEYLATQRTLRPDYGIHPTHKETEYWPITYIEPTTKNLKAIGLDMAFESNRYNAIKKARDTGTAQLTGPITLVQDSKKTPGFLFYTPFYKNGAKPNNIEQRRENIEGVTYAPFIMKNLMLGTLAKKNRHVSLHITDNGETLFNDKTESSIGVDPPPLFTTQIEVNLYGRVWSFLVQSNTSFRDESSGNQSAYILVGGLLIDGFLLGLFFFLTKANRQALIYADQVTNALKAKTKHLEKSNSDLEQFSYVASHDLKSPLNAIKQIASWIEEDCQDILPNESKKHLALLNKRCERMMKLLNDLLDYSRLSRTEFKTETVNLYDTTQDMLQLLEVPKGVTCTAPNIDLIIPKVPLEIILRNLISNSIKHHDKDNGEITILYEGNYESHIITVEDDGPGIPEEFHEKVTKMFQTLQPRDKVEGSGMGLAMVKQIATHYQGSVKISSDGTRGTKITIHFKK